MSTTKHFLKYHSYHTSQASIGDVFIIHNQAEYVLFGIFCFILKICINHVESFMLCFFSGFQAASLLDICLNH